MPFLHFEAHGFCMDILFYDFCKDWSIENSQYCNFVMILSHGMNFGGTWWIWSASQQMQPPIKKNTCATRCSFYGMETIVGLCGCPTLKKS